MSASKRGIFTYSRTSQNKAPIRLVLNIIIWVPYIDMQLTLNNVQTTVTIKFNPITVTSTTGIAML